MVPNDGGRVVDPDGRTAVRGAYVAGWIKRGPTGFIGTNKSCALQTVQHLVDDFNARSADGPVARPAALDKLVRAVNLTWSTPPAGGPSTPPRPPGAAEAAAP